MSLPLCSFSLSCSLCIVFIYFPPHPPGNNEETISVSESTWCLHCSLIQRWFRLPGGDTEKRNANEELEGLFGGVTRKSGKMLSMQQLEDGAADP